MATHPYKPSDPSEDVPRYTGISDLDDILDQTVSAASGIGARVLAGISGVLEQVGDAIDAARNQETEQPFSKWKRRLDRRLQNGKQGSALSIAVTGWTLCAGFGIAALVMFILSAVGPESLGITQEEFMVFPILMACFTPFSVGFGIMGGVGVRQYRYFGRLRQYLRVARDWVSDVAALAHQTMIDRRQVDRDLHRAVANGDLPDALLDEAANTLYWDETRYVQPAAEARQEETPSAAEETDHLRGEGQDFLAYLDACAGRLGPDADEELAQMRKSCAAILSFVHNHPEQMGKVRRFQEYYLPTTRKLLDTAQGLGEADVQHAQEIRRDITGILHTLNQAYSKLYDTLLQDISLDVSTEIDTLETMLRQDGLTHDFETDFKNG